MEYSKERGGSTVRIDQRGQNVGTQYNAAGDVIINHHPAAPVVVPDEPLKTRTDKLPESLNPLFGREAELTMLDAAWEDKNTRVVVLQAWGGVGKTALTREWLERLRRDDWRGARRVFAWSFYSQGATEDRQASADGFFAEALEFFGYAGELPKNPRDKGVRLAECLAQRRALLILDGL